MKKTVESSNPLFRLFHSYTLKMITRYLNDFITACTSLAADFQRY